MDKVGFGKIVMVLVTEFLYPRDVFPIIVTIYVPVWIKLIFDEVKNVKVMFSEAEYISMKIVD